MTMTRILQCVLVLIVLTTAGCSLWEGSGSTNSTNKNANVASNTNADQSTSAQTTPTINARPDNVRGQNQQPHEDVSSTRAQPRGSGSANQNTTDENQNTTSPNQNTDSANQNNISQNHNTASQNQNTSSQNTDETERSFWDLLILVFAIAAGLLVLGLLVMGVQHLRKQSKRKFEAQLAKITGVQVAATREAEEKLADRLTSLAATQKEISNGLLDVHTEVRSLARLLRESSADRNDRRQTSPAINYQAQVEDSQKEEPEFPVSAGDYLGKMDRFANIVRPDFQNGILVNDPDGKGELMLIRDSRFADESQALFVVPRATQFQTKQDFYTYYEKYYDCIRPTAGDVWILGPAVVEKVTGGWRLREKGMLEIR